MGCTRAINYSFSFGSLDWQGPAAGASWHDAKRHPSPPPSYSPFCPPMLFACSFNNCHNTTPSTYSPSFDCIFSSSPPPPLSAKTPTHYSTFTYTPKMLFSLFPSPDPPVPCPFLPVPHPFTIVCPIREDWLEKGTDSLDRHTQTKREQWKEGGRVVGRKVLVFMVNLVYKVKSALYRFNLPVTAHPLSASLPVIPWGGEEIECSYMYTLVVVHTEMHIPYMHTFIKRWMFRIL